jgi:hypothetical protein
MLRHSKVAGEATMPIERTLACYVSLLLGLVVSTDAPAQVNFRIGFAGQVDCDQPVAAKNIPVRMERTGVLNLDGSATAEVTQTAFVLSSTIQFRGRLVRRRRRPPAGPRRCASRDETVCA